MSKAQDLYGFARKTYGPFAWAPEAIQRQRRYQIKKRAAILGYRGAVGGWIYNQDGKAICQGWDSFERQMPRTMLRLIVGNYF